MSENPVDGIFIFHVLLLTAAVIQVFHCSVIANGPRKTSLGQESLSSLTSLTPSLGLRLNLDVRLVFFIEFGIFCVELNVLTVFENPNESWVLLEM